MREQSCSIPRGLKINKNSAEGKVFFVDFPSYRTLRMGIGKRAHLEVTTSDRNSLSAISVGRSKVRPQRMRKNETPQGFLM
jgi:hypothetical protein